MSACRSSVPFAQRRPRTLMVWLVLALSSSALAGEPQDEPKLGDKGVVGPFTAMVVNGAVTGVRAVRESAWLLALATRSEQARDGRGVDRETAEL